MFTTQFTRLNGQGQMITESVVVESGLTLHAAGWDTLDDGESVDVVGAVVPVVLWGGGV